MATGDSSHAERIFKPGMQSSVSNSKSRAYQRALSKNIDAQRRLDTEYTSIDYVKHKARCDVNSQIYQLKAELYKIRAKTPTLNEFRRGKRVVGVENFNQEMANYNNDLYEVINGKVTKSKVKNPAAKQLPSTLIEVFPYGGRPASQASRPKTGQTVTFSGKGKSDLTAEEKKASALEARKQEVAEQTLSSTEIGDKMNEILGLSGPEEEKQEHKDEAKWGTRKKSAGERSQDSGEQRLGQILQLATQADLNSQKRHLYGLGIYNDIETDSDDSDDEPSRRRPTKSYREAASAPARRPGKNKHWRDEEAANRPKGPKSASLESKSRRVRTRRILVDTPRSPSPQQLQEAENEAAVDIDAILNPVSSVGSGNPYSSLFRPETVTVRRIARMSAISRKLRHVEYNMCDDEYEKQRANFVIEKVPASPRNKLTPRNTHNNKQTRLK